MRPLPKLNVWIMNMTFLRSNSTFPGFNSVWRGQHLRVTDLTEDERNQGKSYICITRNLVYCRTYRRRVWCAFCWVVGGGCRAWRSTSRLFFCENALLCWLQQISSVLLLLLLLNTFALGIDSNVSNAPSTPELKRKEEFCQVVPCCTIECFFFFWPNHNRSSKKCSILVGKKETQMIFLGFEVMVLLEEEKEKILSDH